jgi:glycosyltransferase involved in cell wall biosynthesis
MSETQFDVSIITPCYNAGELIQKLGQSLQSQTYKKFQWCIVDDGSDTPTKTIIEEMVRESSLEIQIHFANKSGGNFCRNKGFELSSAPFVKFVDADDFLADDLLQCQIAVAKKNPNAIVVAPTTVYSSDHSYRQYEPSPELLDDPLRSYLKHPTFMHGGCLLPRHVVEDVGGWDEELSAGQDLDFFRRVLITDPQVLFSDSTFFYRQHDSAPRISKLSDRDRLKFESQHLGLVKFQNLLMHRDKLESYRVELARNFDLWGMKAIALGIPNASNFFQSAKALAPDHFRSGSRSSQKMRKLIGDRLTGKLMRSRVWKLTHRVLTQLNLWST